MPHKPIFPLLTALLFALMAVAPASPAQAATILSPECKKLYAQYKTRPSYRSFALSKNGRACGWASGYTTQAANNAQAIKRCQTERQGTCFVYASSKSENRAKTTRLERQSIQRTLNELGFNAGTVDGQFGPATARAISAFQKSIGARQTGKLTPAQQKTLFAKRKAKATAKRLALARERAKQPSKFTSIGSGLDGARLVVNAHRTVLAALDDKTRRMHLFSTRTGGALAALDAKTAVAAFDANGSHVAYQDRYGVLKVMDLTSGALSINTPVVAPDTAPTALALSDTADMLAAGDATGRITLYPAGGGPPFSLRNVRNAILRLEFVNKGRDLLFVTDTGRVVLINLGTRATLSSLEFGKHPDFISVSGDGTFLALYHTGGLVKTYRRAGDTYERGKTRYFAALSGLDTDAGRNEILIHNRAGISFYNTETFARLPSYRIPSKPGASNPLFSDNYGSVVAPGGYSGLSIWARNDVQKVGLGQRARSAQATTRAQAQSLKDAIRRHSEQDAARIARARAAFDAGNCDAFAAEQDIYREGRTAAQCQTETRNKRLRSAMRTAEQTGDCARLKSLSDDLGEGSARVTACFDKRDLAARTARFETAMQALDCDVVAELAPILGKKTALDTCTFNKSMAAPTDREVYFAAMKYDSLNNRPRARALYTQVMERFPASDLAMRAGERLLTLNDLDRADAKQAESEKEIERLRKQAATAEAAAARARADAERARQQAADKANRAPPPQPARNASCDGIGPNYYFRPSKQKLNNAKQALGMILGGALQGMHWRVQYVVRDRGTAYACSEKGNCDFFRCSDIKRWR